MDILFPLTVTTSPCSSFISGIISGKYWKQRKRNEFLPNKRLHVRLLQGVMGLNNLYVPVPFHERKMQLIPKLGSMQISADLITPSNRGLCTFNTFPVIRLSFLILDWNVAVHQFLENNQDKSSDWWEPMHQAISHFDVFEIENTPFAGQNSTSWQMSKMPFTQWWFPTSQYFVTVPRMEAFRSYSSSTVSVTILNLIVWLRMHTFFKLLLNTCPSKVPFPQRTSRSATKKCSSSVPHSQWWSSDVMTCSINLHANTVWIYLFLSKRESRRFVPAGKERSQKGSQLICDGLVNFWNHT